MQIAFFLLTDNVFNFLIFFISIFRVLEALGQGLTLPIADGSEIINNCLSIYDEWLGNDRAPPCVMSEAQNYLIV